jgi:hypothetical protein
LDLECGKKPENQKQKQKQKQNKTKKLKNVENETHTLQDMEYGEKTDQKENK